MSESVTPARLSADLTMADGRVVHVPVVPPAKEPATAGKIWVGIPYPADAERGFVTAVAVTNEDLHQTFRGYFDPDLPPVGVEPGDTLHIALTGDDL